MQAFVILNFLRGPALSGPGVMPPYFLMIYGKIKVISYRGGSGGAPMKTYLIVSQSLYALSLAAWLVIWGLSFMAFDNGFAFWNTAFVIAITLYPVAIVVCSILAWAIRKRKRQAAVLVNLVPLLWVFAFAIFMWTV